MGFMSCPVEIRDCVYSHILSPEANKIDLGEGFAKYNFEAALNLFRVNRQIGHEAQRIFHNLNTFVRIETPWEDAVRWVARRGQVPLIASGPTATKFNYHTLSVEVDAPAHVACSSAEPFVIHINDLTDYCKVWYYSNLDRPGLNGHLTLKLGLRDPFAATPAEARVSLGVQRRLLEPFGQVKSLSQVDITGTPEPDGLVVESMRKTMAEPLESPEMCLAATDRLKDAGNVELQAGRYHEALECYRQAWLAMHVIIKGRHRVVHGEQYFDRILDEAPYRNQHGGTVRVVLRIRLVANSLLAYLKLNDYDMAIFTGMRSIHIVRENIGLAGGQEAADPTHEVFGQFVAAAELGKIYYRTALAYKAKDDKYEARKLLKVAVLYLPNDKTVQAELAACALRLG